MSIFNEKEKKEINEVYEMFDEIQQNQNDPNLNKIFFKKFKAIKKIADGSFGSVYEGISLKTKNKVAIKLEDRNQYNLLETEAYNLFNLKGFGIVKLISFGKNKNYNIMIQSLLGDSLYKIYLSHKKRFTLKDICLIGIQCLDRIEWIHIKNVIHRDIKPDNFLVGLKDPRIIYLIDFGLCKKYRSERTLKHIQFTLTKKLTGTARYASVNALKGFELSRRDDLESFCYMIIFFIIKKLPWQGVKAQTQAKRNKKICEAKEEFKIDEYNNIIPKEIIKIFKYVKKLKFDEEPNYDKIRNLFKVFLNEINYNENDTFSWIKDKRVLSLKKSSDMHRKRSSRKKRILEKLEEDKFSAQKSPIFSNSISLNTLSPGPIIKVKKVELKIGNPLLSSKNEDNNLSSLNNNNNIYRKINNNTYNNASSIKENSNNDFDRNNHFKVKSLNMNDLFNNNNNNKKDRTTESRKACLEYDVEQSEEKINTTFKFNNKNPEQNLKNFKKNLKYSPKNNLTKFERYNNLSNNNYTQNNQNMKNKSTALEYISSKRNKKHLQRINYQQSDSLKPNYIEITKEYNLEKIRGLSNINNNNNTNLNNTNINYSNIKIPIKKLNPEIIKNLKTKSALNSKNLLKNKTADNFKINNSINYIPFTKK